MANGLQGKVALVTGGSRGIGKAVGMALAAGGVRLGLCARDEIQLKRAADEIQAATRAEVVAVKANVTKLNDVRRFVATVAKKFDRIDILVNNAGGMHVGGLFSTTDEEWEYQIQLKLLGYVRMAREVIPHMRLQSGGRIINVAGMAAREPDRYFMVPGVSNAAILNFTKSLSKELEADRITVNSVNPGTTDTSLTDRTFESLATVFQKTPAEVRESAARSFPRGTLPSADDVAKVIVFLASDAAVLVNGTVLHLDAGRSAGSW